jgi:glycosyltransferase involved in cell wall biosynthesis
LANIRSPHIHELGKLDLQEKTDLLRACTMVCLPSTQESFGGVLVEAWASGKPVIAGPAAAIAEVVDDRRDGYYISSQSPALVAERAIWLLDNPGAAAEFGAAGAQKVADRFSWDRLAARTEDVYRSVR